MAGPNPYKLHSFRELRAVMGRTYIACRPCQRFVGIGTRLDHRDTRTTTFSCTVCGGPGTMMFEDPAQEGLQHDPRSSAPRHPDVILRHAQLARLSDPYGHRAARESLPQREKPRQEPPPRYRLVPLPIATFREARAFGLGLRIHCPRCHDWRPIELTADQLDRPFAGSGRFICARVKGKIYGEGTQVCGCVGQPHFSPVGLRDHERTVVCLECGGTRRQPHVRWEITDIDLERPPWSGRLGKGERFRCPGCGNMPRHSFHVPYVKTRPAEATTGTD